MGRGIMGGQGKTRVRAAFVGALLAIGPGGASAAEGRQARIAPAFDDGPVHLSAAIAAALERHRDIVDAGYQLDVASAQVSEAWSSVYPSLDLTSSFTRNVAPQVSFLPAQIFDPNAAEGEFIPVQFGADNIWNLTVNAEQPLFRPSVLAGVGAAGQYRGLQREALRGRTQAAVTQVRIAFYDLLLAQEDVRLTENSLRRVRESLKETRAMQDAGLASAYDVLRLEVELANLEPNLGRARNRRIAARRTLASELDIDPESNFEVAGSLAEMNMDDPEANSPANRDVLRFAEDHSAIGIDVAAAVARSTADRSDLRQLEITEDLRQAELRVEQVGYLPSVFAFGNYVLAAQQNGPADFFGTSQQRGTTRQVGVRVSFPLFSGFSRNARIDQRRAALRQAEVQTRIAVDRAEVELRNLVDQVQEARARTSGQRLAVAQAQRGYEIASAQYAEGLNSQLERTDAEVALRQSEFNYAQAVYDFLVAGARLDHAAGRVPMVDVEGGRR